MAPNRHDGGHAADDGRRGHSGSELNVPLLRKAGVEFQQGDVRSADDVALGGRPIDMIVECAAEPSVMAGYGDGSRYVVEANLGGLVNCVELAREREARVFFLSTSRVYPVARVKQLAVTVTDTRYALDDQPGVEVAFVAGISEAFSLGSERTLYGTTKLAGELLLEEYAAAFGVEYVINRLGVIAGPGQMGTVLIPAHNEGGSIVATVGAIEGVLKGADIPHEIRVVLDHRTDDTEAALRRQMTELSALRIATNPGTGGFGFTVRHGLDVYAGDAVVVAMVDASDDPRDIVTYSRKFEEGFDCAFGSRFIGGAAMRSCPWQKLLLNRTANWFVRVLFRERYNDFTNAFKCYRRTAIDGCRPLLSNHFNLTIELPLKVTVRGFSWTVVPTNWYGREVGESKFLIKEMGSRYVYIIHYALIEKFFSRADYRRSGAP